MRLIVETQRIKDIPVTVVAPENARNCPTVFFVHGLWADKSIGMELGYLLGQKGFVFVSVDAYMHGERYDSFMETFSDPDKTTYPPESRLDLYFHLFTITQKTGDDISTLMDVFEKDERVDSNRIGMAGVSMGAFTTYYCACRDPRLKAIAPIIGLSAFTRRWEDLILEKESEKRWRAAIEAVSAETQRRTELVRSVDPLHNLHRMQSFAPKPILMMVGELDTDAPKYYSMGLYKELFPLYREHPDRLCLHVESGIAHRVLHGMWLEVANWFDSYLR